MDRVVPERSIVFMATHPSGGVRELWANLAEGFIAQGYTAKLAAFYPVSEAAEESTLCHWRHLAEGRPVGLRGRLALLWVLAGWLRKERPHTIVTAMPAANVIVPAVARIVSPQTRVVISHHSPVDTHDPRLNALDGFAGGLRNVRAVVSVSDAVGMSLAAKPAGYLAKRRTIHNALPPYIEALLDRLAPPLPRPQSRRHRVVATGRLAYQKNYPVLLDALAQTTGIELDIVGQGPDEADLKAQVERLAICDRVHFHGHRAREDALQILAGGDVFVQMSRFEGHSLGLIEAARLGLPIIVSDIPVQVEAITSRDGQACALALALDDADGLARAMAALFADPANYVAWSQRSRRIADEAAFADVMARYRDLFD